MITSSVADIDAQYEEMIQDIEIDGLPQVVLDAFKEETSIPAPGEITDEARASLPVTSSDKDGASSPVASEADHEESLKEIVDASSPVVDEETTALGTTDHRQVMKKRAGWWSLIGALSMSTLGGGYAYSENDHDMPSTRTAVAADSKHEVEVDNRPLKYPEFVGFENRLKSRSLYLLLSRNWWEYPMYTDPEFFEMNSEFYPNFEKKEPMTLNQTLEIIKPKPSNPTHKIPHFLNIESEIPQEIVLVGRPFDGFQRDKMFYEHSKNIIEDVLDGNRQNTLFINFTGHSGAVGAVFAEKNIPVYWQIDTSGVSGERIVNMIRDYDEAFKNNTFQNDSNLAIMLEPRHNPSTNHLTNVDLLPMALELEIMGIKNVIVFTEEAFSGEYYSIETSWGYGRFPFFRYLDGLISYGIDVTAFGTDEKEELEKSKSDGKKNKQEVVSPTGDGPIAEDRVDSASSPVTSSDKDGASSPVVSEADQEESLKEIEALFGDLEQRLEKPLSINTPKLLQALKEKDIEGYKEVLGDYAEQLGVSVVSSDGNFYQRIKSNLAMVFNPLTWIKNPLLIFVGLVEILTLTSSPSIRSSHDGNDRLEKIALNKGILLPNSIALYAVSLIIINGFSIIAAMQFAVGAMLWIYTSYKYFNFPEGHEYSHILQDLIVEEFNRDNRFSGVYARLTYSQDMEPPLIWVSRAIPTTKQFAGVLESLINSIDRIYPPETELNPLKGVLIISDSEDSETAAGASSPIESEDEPLGGIDLNPNNLDLQTQGEQFEFQLPAGAIDFQNIHIDGFTPVIINVAPLTNLPLLLGLVDEERPFESAQGDRSNDLSQLNPINRIERFRVEELESAVS